MLRSAVGICLLLGGAAADLSYATSSVGQSVNLIQRSSSSDFRALIPVAPYLFLQPESNATFLGLRIWNVGATNTSLSPQSAGESRAGYILFARKSLHAVQAEAEVVVLPALPQPTPRPRDHHATQCPALCNPNMPPLQRPAA